MVAPHARSGRRGSLGLIAVLLVSLTMPGPASAVAGASRHPRRLAGNPIGHCFAATLDNEDRGLRVPGTIRPSGLWGGYDDSLPPWLCDRPLTDFAARVPRLARLVRAGMALDRTLVEFEACYRSGRQAILDAGLAAGDSRHCLTAVPLPGSLCAAVDSIERALGPFEGAQHELAWYSDDSDPTTRALAQSAHMETLVLVDLLGRWVPHAGPGAREFVSRPPYERPLPGGGSWSFQPPVDSEFLNGLYDVRWNLDSWLRELVSVSQE